MNAPKKTSYDGLGFAEFSRMATDPKLSPNEKIGFPDAYRKGFEAAIHQDILAKLPNLGKTGQHVLDIGPGCAGLPKLLMEECRRMQHRLVLIDSEEMLGQLPDGPGVAKIAGFYPDCMEDAAGSLGTFDVIICYSVLHYIFVEAKFWRFIDLSLKLLAPGGQMLIGDIPNISKRKRFFSAESGIRFHQEFMQTSEVPNVRFGVVEDHQIDDAALLGLIMRVRAQGADAYWMPQPNSLPMANRREDIVIYKP